MKGSLEDHQLTKSLPRRVEGHLGSEQKEQWSAGIALLAIRYAGKPSHPGTLTMLQLVQNLIQSIHSYDNMMDISALAAWPEGQRPGGALAAPLMQSSRLVLARHGSMPVLTSTSSMQDPGLIAFVNFIDHVLRPGNSFPLIEIQFLRSGLAGLSVDLTRWGHRYVSQ